MLLHASGRRGTTGPTPTAVSAGGITLKDGTTTIGTMSPNGTTYTALNSVSTSTLKWTDGDTIDVSAAGDSSLVHELTPAIIRGFIVEMKRLGVLVLFAFGCGSSSSANDGGADASPPQDSAGSDVVTTTDASEAGATGPTVGGCPMFPANYPYNVDISGTPLDPGSATYISNLKARAGAIVAEYPGDEYVNIVPASQAMVPVGTTASYGFDTNDAFFQNNGAGATAPIPSGVLYENSSNPNSDHHMMIVEQGTCTLYELYAWNPSSATTGW